MSSPLASHRVRRLAPRHAPRHAPRRAPRLALHLALVTLGAACVRVSATPLSNAVLPAVPADSVQVFATRAPAEYAEVAVLRAEKVLRGDAAALRALREHAGRLGANGLLLLGASRAPGGADVGGVIVGGANGGGILVGQANERADPFARAVAIRLPAPSAGGSDAGAGTTPR